MSNRYYHHRWSPARLSEAFNAVGWTIGEFIRHTGVSRQTVLGWLKQNPEDHGPGDIPHWVAVLMSIVEEIPRARDIAERVTGEQVVTSEAVIEQIEEQNREKRERERRAR